MSDLNSRERVEWPARAVVTAGMPYGNKPLHFGHIGGVFVPADAFARFLRDRIGAENVRFVSGTDCFGSPINEGYRKLVEAGEFSGTIADYVLANHERQKNTLTPTVSLPSTREAASGTRATCTR
ncbi:MAG: class I tRNA ligase family protein [Adlercreutzia sp.]